MPAQVVDEAEPPGQPRTERAGLVGTPRGLGGRAPRPSRRELAGVALQAVDLGRPVGVGNPGDRVEHRVSLARPQQARAPPVASRRESGSSPIARQERRASAGSSCSPNQRAAACSVAARTWRAAGEAARRRG